MGNNGELPVSEQLREWVIPIKERQMIRRWYYSEINEKLNEIKKGSTPRHFSNEGKYQTYSPKVDSKEKNQLIIRECNNINKERERERRSKLMNNSVIEIK